MNFELRVIVAAVAGLMGGGATAGTFSTLHSFTVLNNNTNNDGANPHAGLVLSGGTLYGTAYNGGAAGGGTLFAVGTDGTGFTNLYSFAGGLDGANPYAGLVLSSNTLYGTAENGGILGTAFAINTNGTGFGPLHAFAGSTEGGFPLDRPVLSGNALYGTTSEAGNGPQAGTVFTMRSDGSNFTTLYRFTALSTNGPYTNSDGNNPHDLALSGNRLYGTASLGGSSGNGTVFAINTDGSGFTNLHNFTATGAVNGTNADGAYPVAGLLISGDTLYGTALLGGQWGLGTVFKLKTNGTFTTLHHFAGAPAEGANPYAGLVLSGNTLYGTTDAGGSTGNGTVFALNTDGTGFSTLYTFTALAGFDRLTNSDGAAPLAGLALWSNTLYGTTAAGGPGGNGTAFSLVIAVKLAVIHSGRYVILTWPTNYPGFTLQSTTNLVSPVVWTTNLPPPAVVNGLNTVTNLVSGTRQFYRLIQ